MAKDNSLNRRLKHGLISELRSIRAFFCLWYFRFRVVCLRKMGLDPVLKGVDATLVKAGALACFCNDGGLEVSSLRFGHKPLLATSGGVDLVFGSTQKKDVIDSLTSKGFYIVQDFLSRSECAEVVDFARRTRCYPRPRDGCVAVSPEVLSAPYQSARYDFSPDVHLLFDKDPFVEMISNQDLINVAEGYFGSKAYLDPVELWWFLPFSVRDPAWAENYHFDFDAFRWLKFFVNFEWISLEEGPHCFVEGSHNPSDAKADLVKKGYSRLSDERVINAYGRDAEQVFEVPPGCLLIEDTSGFHKGLTPVAGSRLLFSFQWSNSLLLDYETLRKRKRYTENRSAFDRLYQEGRLARYFY